MIFSLHIRRVSACAAWWLIAGSAFAQGPSATPANPATPATKDDLDAPFWLREVWVPANDLAPVLARYPRAVPLSHDQLITLLHDAQAADPAAPDPAHAPPERAVLRQARFEGRLLAGPDGNPQVNVDSWLEVEAFSDAWADVPLGLPGIALGSVELDDAPTLGPASLRRSGDGTDHPARLQLQGRGPHHLRLGFTVPVGNDAAGNFVGIPQIDGVGEFILHLPAGTRADCQRGCAMEPEDSGWTAHVPLGPASERLHWRTPPPGPAQSGAVLQDGRVDVSVEAERVVVRQAVTLRPALGRLPGEARLPMPNGARAIRVENAGGRWDIGGDGLRVALSPAEGAKEFTVRYDLPLTLDPQGKPARVGVPWLEVAGAHRVTGQLGVSNGAGVQVRRIEPGAVATPAADHTEGRIAAFALSDLPAPDAPPPTALTLEARRTTARFVVDADARADFQLDGVHLERTLAFHVEEGDVFAARVHLPPGEMLLGVRPTDGSPAPDWRQEGGDLVLSWKTGLAESSKAVLILDTRADLPSPKPGTPTNFSLEAVLVPGAERLTGYVALASTPALRLVTVGGEDTLERRDGRTTPVRGDVAWFYREGFRLALRVERRAAETEARFTGYALPLAGAVEIHAQMDYHFLFSGVETVRIRVPRESADAFFFTGKNIAERRRDDDVWTIRFQGEQSGDYALGIQATIPAPADKDDAQRFHFRLPAVVPLDGARWSGAWAVEANTDTEIRFTATGANEADALHAPPLAGYEPTRRVIGVFEFTGGGRADAAIDLDGVRHPAAGVTAGVVDRLDLETFVSTSGVSRHRATLRARTAGDGFFDLRLPAGATLWSLTRNGEPVKPVGGSGAAAGVVRVELPGGRAPAQASTVAVIYETPGSPWASGGKWELAAPTFDPGVPVVRSSWKLRLPDGFDYRFSEPPNGASPPAVAPGDLLLSRIGMALGETMVTLAESPFPVFSSVQRRGRARKIQNDAQVEMDVDASAPAAAANPEIMDEAKSSDDRAAVAAIERKLNAIIIPKIEFHATTVSDAIEYLRQEARRLDTAASSDTRGVSIFLKLPVPPTPVTGPESPIPGLPDASPGASPATGPGDSRRITLTLDHVPLLEALRYIASQVGMKVKVERYAVSIVPVTEQTDVMVTANFKVPSSFFASGNDGSTAPAGRMDARTFLEASGVTFPPGASATYLAATSKLVVRDTQENIDLIEALIQENTAPAPPGAPVSPPTLTILSSDDKADKSMVTVELDHVSPGLISGISPGNNLLRNGALNQAAVSAQSSGATDSTGVGTVTIARQDAKTFLEASGVAFPPGTSATYLASTGKLVVRNTRENIDALARSVGVQGPPSGGTAYVVDALMSGVAGKTAPPDAFGMAGVYTGPQFENQENERVAGLLPLRLDLPVNGQLYTFAGGGEPGALEFRYTDWRAAARWRWICLTLGALGFLALAAGWAHPWRRTLYAVLALTFLPLIAAPSGLVTCNALLAGWLWALAGWCLTRFLLRRRRPLAAVAALLCFGALPTSRAETPPANAPETVIVPYDATKPVTGQQPLKYYLPYERFLTLWDAAKQHRRPPVPEPPPGGEPYVLSASRYDARLAGDTLEISATLDLRTSGDAWVEVPLRFDGLTVATVTLDGAPAALSGDAKLWVGTPGAHRVNAGLRLRMANTAPGTHYSWDMPSTAATLLTLQLPRADLRLDVHGKGANGGVIEETTPDGARRLTASLGGATGIELAFREATPPAPAAGQPALAHVETRLVAGTRAETVDARTRFSFPGGTQDHFTVFLDRSLTLTGLDAPDIKAWHLDTGGDRQTLDLTLNGPARDGYQFALTADRPLPALPATRRAFPVVSARAGRVETVDALRADDGVELTLADGPPTDARRVPDTSQGEGRSFAAFEGNGAVSLVYSVRAAAGKRTAHVDYLYQVGRGKIDLAASARLVPAEGGFLSTVDLRLPPGFAVQAVAGAAVRQWWREGDVLSLRFAPGAAAGAEVPLVIYLVRQFDRAPERFSLQPLVAEGFAETDGQVVVAADRAVTVGLTLPTGARAADLGEIDPGTAAGEFQVKPPLERQRAFRYRGAGFEVEAALETQPARWQAQWVTQATVREGVVAWATHVNVSARQGVADTLEFSLPAGLPEARVSGPDVRDTLEVPDGGKDRRTYRVLFQNPVYADSEVSFVVNLELPLGADGHVSLPDLSFREAGGGRSSGGFLLVENISDGEMTLDPRGLDPAIEKDIPFLPPQIVAGTRFFRAAPDVPWSLGVHLAALEKTAGRAALVSYAELTSTLRAGGEEWHRAVYHLQNRRLQFLPVELPPGTEFIGARVAGESVRVDAGKAEDGTPLLLVPLLKTRPGELSYDVELVYRRPAPGPGGRRQRASFFEHWQMADPTLPGVAIEKTLWNVWLPEDMRLLSSGGNVEPVLAALNETEKYESALSDLRSLSATYASTGASQQERQRALTNFQTLADTVTRGTTLGLNGRIDEGRDQGALLKQSSFFGQQAAVGEKKKEIQREIDSLNSANVRTQQQPQARLFRSDANFHRESTGLPTFDGFINYGSPINTTSTANVSGAASAAIDIPIFSPGWRDNRPAGPQKPTDAIAGGFVATQSGQNATVPVERTTTFATSAKGQTAVNGGQLALNDSLSVDVQESRDAEFKTMSEVNGGLTGITLDQNRLSTARAVGGTITMSGMGGMGSGGAGGSIAGSSTSMPAHPDFANARRADKDLPAPTAQPPADELAQGTSPAASPAETRVESLRSVGRISLAVDFPEEGQVYHFKKLKADARLTLWSARPERFVPLGWLALLGWILLLLWVSRRRQRARRGVVASGL